MTRYHVICQECETTVVTTTDISEAWEMVDKVECPLGHVAFYIEPAQTERSDNV